MRGYGRRLHLLMFQCRPTVQRRAQLARRLGTLRDWEQGAAEPDQAARAYLKVIACDPEAVRRALEAPHQPRP